MEAAYVIVWDFGPLLTLIKGSEPQLNWLISRRKLQLRETLAQATHELIHPA